MWNRFDKTIVAGLLTDDPSVELRFNRDEAPVPVEHHLAHSIAVYPDSSSSSALASFTSAVPKPSVNQP
jgi:hypothetical protein